MKARYIAPLALTLALGACGDLLSLEEEPKTFLAENQFYRNAADAEAALYAIYSPMTQTNYYRREWPVILLSMADHINARGSYQPGAGYEWSQTTMGRVWGGWSLMYSAINNANLVIARVPAIEMNEDRKRLIIAEAHFLRALNYLNLVRYWGAVPLRLEPASGLESLSAPRASVEEVYAAIIADLQHAEQVLPGTADNGRPSRWSATTMLADIHLGREQWTQAAAKAKEVIDAGAFSLIEVESPGDFIQMFGPDVDKTSEEIYDIAFTRQTGFGLELASHLAASGSGYAARENYTLFADGDADWLFTWDSADLRHDYNLYVGEDEQYLTVDWPQLFKKFTDDESTERNGNGNDFPVYRYADILLMYAEATAMANGGPTAESYEALNQIRRRAYGLPLNAPAPGVDVPGGLSLEDFRDRLIQERAYEFMVEGKRYWDLKRTGKLEAAILAVGEPYDPKYMLFPLPRTELDSNEALTLEDQNPGW